MFDDRHKLSDSDIARALGSLHEPCVNMTGEEVVELYRFLHNNPDLHTNGIRYWQGIKDSTAMKKEKQDNRRMVAKAIRHFQKRVAIKDKSS